jgi:hypothetical protein
LTSLLDLLPVLNLTSKVRSLELEKQTVGLKHELEKQTLELKHKLEKQTLERKRELEKQTFESQIESLTIENIAIKFLNQLKTMENPTVMLSHFTDGQMQAPDLDMEIFLANYRHSNQRRNSDNFFGSVASSQHTGRFDISQLRRKNVKPGFFVLRRWDLVNSLRRIIPKFGGSEAFDQFVREEGEILSQVRSAIVFLINQQHIIDELNHLERIYILYKTAFLGRLRSIVHHENRILPSNAHLLKMSAPLCLQNTKAFCDKEVTGYSDVCTGNFDLGTGISNMDIQTIEELKSPSSKYLKCGAAHAKDQSLFQAACLAEMRRAKPNDFFFTCLTDLFSIRISAVSREGEKRIHYLAPSGLTAATFVQYQLLIHCLTADEFRESLDEATSTPMVEATDQYEESCPDKGDDEGDAPPEAKEEEEKESGDKKPSHTDLGSHLSRGAWGLSFKSEETLEEYEEKVREVRDWAFQLHGKAYLSASNLATLGDQRFVRRCPV